MMRRTFVPSLLLVLTASTVLRAADGPATDPEIALQRKLDQRITLTLDQVALAEAFKQTAAAADISLQVDPACYDLLPYGSTITISTEFRQSKLRDSLEEMLLPLGLQYTVSGRTVIIQPSSALAHTGRRATWDELKLIQDLHTAGEIKPATGPLNLAEAVRGVVESRKDLAIIMVPATPAGPADPAAVAAAVDQYRATSTAALEQIRKQLPMSPYRALDIYAQLTNQVWFVETGALAGGPIGGTIRIMSRRQWIERQLDRPVQFTHNKDPLELVVNDLNHLTGIRFVPEPGLYQVVPSINVSSNNDSVKRILEQIAGSTGIAFEVRDDSVLLHLAPAPAGAGDATPKVDPLVGHIALPVGPNGEQVDMYIHESDLTPELRKLRELKIKESVGVLQKAWTTPATGPATGPVPASAPATQAKSETQP